MPPQKRRHELGEGLGDLLESYLASEPPPGMGPAGFAGPASDRKLIRALVHEVESLKKARSSLAEQLGTSIRDSGTFEPVSQERIDSMMAQVELARVKGELKLVETTRGSEIASLRRENARHRTAVRVLVAALVVLVGVLAKLFLK